MRAITIPIPDLAPEQMVEVEVKVDDETRKINYRIEMYEWGGMRSSEDRVLRLRQILAEHDQSWQLVEIGIPTETSIPLMFRQKK